MQLRTQMDKQGKIHIPLSIRKELNIKPGKLIIRVIDNEIRIISLDKMIDDVRKLIAHNPDSISVDNFLEIRKNEAYLEEEKYNRLVDNNDKTEANTDIDKKDYE